MPNAPIKSPVGGRSALDLLREQNPAAYQDYLGIKHDTPVNFRDGHERKKKTYRPDTFDHQRPQGDSQ